MDFGTFVEEYETAMQDATDLSAYITYMQLDYLYSVFGYGLTFYSLLFLLTFDADWFKYTVPISVILDYVEGTLTWIALATFENDASVSGLVYLMPLNSSIKWGLAGLNIVSVPVLAIWRLYEYLVADD